MPLLAQGIRFPTFSACSNRKEQPFVFSCEVFADPERHFPLPLRKAPETPPAGLPAARSRALSCCRLREEYPCDRLISGVARFSNFLSAALTGSVRTKAH